MDEKENQVIITSKSVTTELRSPDKSMTLIMAYEDDINPQKTFVYKVINSKTKEEVANGTFVGTKMEWIDNSSIKGYLYQGMIKNEKASLDSADAASDNFKIIKLN
jgi:hypothetical protein